MLSPRGLQCHHLCIWADRNRQDIHHGRILVQFRAFEQRHHSSSHSGYLRLHLRLGPIGTCLLIKITFMVRASYIQIYNENVSDLLRN